MKEKIEQFKERWESKANEIKKQTFDKDRCFVIIKGFLQECPQVYINEKNRSNPKSNSEITAELKRIENNLKLALEIASSNFQKNNKSGLKNITNIFMLCFEKLKIILLGEDKFFSEYPHLKKPTILLTGAILIGVYIIILLMITKAISYLLLSLNVPYNNYFAVGVVVIGFIVIIILQIKNNGGGK